MLLYVQQKMIYELRTYQVVPGKMAELNARFREITTGLFEKHGMIIIGFWETGFKIIRYASGNSQKIGIINR